MTAEVRAGATDESVANASDSAQLKDDLSSSAQADRIADISKYESQDLAEQQATALRAAYSSDLALADTSQDHLVYTDGNFTAQGFQQAVVDGDTATVVMTGNAVYDTVSGATTDGTLSTYTITLTRDANAADGWLVTSKIGTVANG